MVNIWRLGKPAALMTLSGHTTPITSVRFDAAEEAVSAGSQGGTVKLFALGNGGKTVRNLSGHQSDVITLDTHPYHQYMLSGSSDTTMKVWDIRRKTSCLGTYRGHTDKVSQVLFSPDGSIAASGGHDGVVNIWDLTAAKLLYQFKNSHASAITSIAFHPSEFILATASLDKTIKFWDIDQFNLVSTITTGNSAARCIKFEGGGGTLLASMQDQMKCYEWSDDKCRSVHNVDVPWNNVADFAIQTKTKRVVACSMHESFVSPFLVRYAPKEHEEGGRGPHRSDDVQSASPGTDGPRGGSPARVKPRNSPRHTSPIVPRSPEKQAEPSSSPGRKKRNEAHQRSRARAEGTKTDEREDKVPGRSPPEGKRRDSPRASSPIIVSEGRGRKPGEPTSPPSAVEFGSKKDDGKRATRRGSPVGPGAVPRAGASLAPPEGKGRDLLDESSDDSDAGADDFNFLEGTKVQGLDYKAFAPKSKPAKRVDEEKILKQMLEDREIFMNILTERLRETRALQTMWFEGDVEGAIESVLELNDINPGVAIDFFRFANLENNPKITLRLACRLLQVLDNLLSQNGGRNGSASEHKTVIVEATETLHKSFYELIARNRQAAAVHVGQLDIAAEDRNRRSEKCYQYFVRILGKDKCA